MAAVIEVPFPFNIPEMEVPRVITGAVAVPPEVLLKPLAEATEMLVIPPATGVFQTGNPDTSHVNTSPVSEAFASIDVVFGAD